MKITQLCSEERPRERIISQGVSSVSGAELLAVLLRTGTTEENVVELARRLLSDCDGSLTELSARSLENLAAFKGIGKTKAVTLAAAFELGRRMGQEGFRLQKKAISSARDIYELIGPRLKGLKREECWMAMLNQAQYVIREERVSYGDDISTVFDTRDIVKRALECKARKLILMHNHPSGNPVPGQADIRQTQKLREALAPFDIKLIDHIVVCDDCYYSFCDEQIYTARDKALKTPVPRPRDNGPSLHKALLSDPSSGSTGR